VVAVEGVEGTEGRPSSTEELSRVGKEAADVGTDHWYLKEGRKLKHVANRHSVLIPACDVISKPVGDFAAGSHESTSCNDKRPFSWSAEEHGFAACCTHHCTVSRISQQSATREEKIHTSCVYHILRVHCNE
jgi:hypothetical protein